MSSMKLLVKNIGKYIKLDAYYFSDWMEIERFKSPV